MATAQKLEQNIVQTKAKAAVKTFFQALVGSAGVLLLAWIASATGVLAGGGDLREIDPRPLLGILAIGVLAGIAALTSVAMNWSKPPVAPPPPAEPVL